MEPILNYTFNFTKDPPHKSITKKYFIEWIWVGAENEKYIIDCKDFNSFTEARDYNNASQENGIGYLFRNRRYLCPIK